MIRMTCVCVCVCLKVDVSVLEKGIDRGREAGRHPAHAKLVVC